MRTSRAVVIWLSAGTAVAGCAAPAESDTEAESPAEVRLVTSAEWSISDDMRNAFQRQTGLELVVVDAGADSGELTEALLAADGVAGDVALGVDSASAQPAVDGDVFEPYTSPEANQGQQRYIFDSQQRLSAIDLSATCVIADVDHFAEQDQAFPEDLGELVDADHGEQLVIPSPLHSAEGVAFLLSTIARSGEDGWQDYWRELMANEALVVDDANEAFGEEFSGGSVGGERPLVVAAASAPGSADEEDLPESAALPETCYQQVRYAGVLAGTANEEQARRVVDFLLSQQFQATLAEQMGTYPTREGVQLPDRWDELAPLPDDPFALPPGEVASHLERWLDEWLSVVES